MKLPHRRQFLQLAAAAALPAVSRFAWAQAYRTQSSITTTAIEAGPNFYRGAGSHEPCMNAGQPNTICQFHRRAFDRNMQSPQWRRSPPHRKKCRKHQSDDDQLRKGSDKNSKRRQRNTSIPVAAKPVGILHQFWWKPAELLGVWGSTRKAKRSSATTPD